MLTRRMLLGAGALAVATPFARGARAAPRVAEVRMTADATGARVWFDPADLEVETGTTIRWVVVQHVHTTAADPDRIPAGARPWDSGYLVHPGDAFEVTLTVPGVYHYVCRPHAAAGMVGRIVVRRP